MDFEVKLTPRRLIKEAIKAAKEVAEEAHLSKKATFRAKMFTVDVMFRLIENVTTAEEDSDDEFEILIEQMMDAIAEEDD